MNTEIINKCLDCVLKNKHYISDAVGYSCYYCINEDDIRCEDGYCVGCRNNRHWKLKSRYERIYGFTVKELKLLFKINKLKGISKCCKNDLLNILSNIVDDLEHFPDDKSRFFRLAHGFLG